MRDIRNIVILTGAGISAESGLATFRGPDGLWEGHRVEDVATPEAFARDPVLVQRFYDARRAALGRVEPNAAHRALARLDAEWPGELLIVTQNVDDLHERAGAVRLLHMHGELMSAWCLGCDARVTWDGPMLTKPVRVERSRDTPSSVAENRSLDFARRGPSTSLGTNGEGEAVSCPSCGASGQLRPDIVWFGEMPYGMDRIEAALAEADLFVSIGTSGAVYPAAGYVQTARYHGADTLELNLDPSAGSIFFHETRIGPAGVLVPAWVDEVMALQDH